MVILGGGDARPLGRAGGNKLTSTGRDQRLLLLERLVTRLLRRFRDATFVTCGVLDVLGRCCGVGWDSPIGQQIKDFKARDYRGRETSLAEFADQKAVVVAFLGTECPLAKLYGPRLEELAGQYKGQGVAFIGLDANRQDSIAEISNYARTHGVTFPILKDVGNVIADQFGASARPKSTCSTRIAWCVTRGASTTSTDWEIRRAMPRRKYGSDIWPLHSTSCWLARRSASR